MWDNLSLPKGGRQPLSGDNSRNVSTNFLSEVLGSASASVLLYLSVS